MPDLYDEMLIRIGEEIFRKFQLTRKVPDRTAGLHDDLG